MGCHRRDKRSGSGLLQTGVCSSYPSISSRRTTADVTRFWALQILALSGTKVIAGARPGENQDDLKLLSDQHEGRLLPVQMELLDKDSVKVSLPPLHRPLRVLSQSSHPDLPCYFPQAAMNTVEAVHTDGVDFLINNAGVLGHYTRAQEQ